MINEKSKITSKHTDARENIILKTIHTSKIKIKTFHLDLTIKHVFVCALINKPHYNQQSIQCYHTVAYYRNLYI